MVPAARRDRVEASLYVKPIWVPARSLTVALTWDVIIVGVTFFQRPLGVLKWARRVSAGAPCCMRCTTRRRKASFGHSSGSPVDPWTIFFTLQAIFLCGEDKYHKCGDGEFIISGSGGIKYRLADTEGYIWQAKWCAVIFCACVLSWLQEEEKGNYDHVHEGLQILIIGGRGHAGHTEEDLDWYWLYPRRRGVLPRV